MHNHTEVIWGALCIIFLIYAASSFVHLENGELGTDAFNVIGVFGGVLAAIAAGIIGTVTALGKRKARSNSKED